MAHFEEPTPQQETEYREWVAARPPAVRAVAERFEPWTLYRMKSTGQRVTICSFTEQKDGRVTLRVNVTGQFNAHLFDSLVFGIDPDDLEPCDLPGEDEVLGAILSTEQVAEKIRVGLRSDLFEMGSDGIASAKAMTLERS